MKGKRVIITGGAGFVGSNLVEVLSKNNMVLVLDNMHTGNVINLNGMLGTENVKLVELDSSEIDKCGFTPDVIFHLGMYSSTPMYKENRNLVPQVIDGATQVLEYAKKTNAKVVIASSSSIYNGHPTPQHEGMVPKVTDFYTEARLGVERLAELYGKMYGVNSTCMRFFSIYGPREKSKGRFANLISQFIWDLQDGKNPEVYGDGSQSRDFIYVKDVVDALVTAAESNKTGIYNVGTGKSYTINEMLQKLGEQMGREVRPKYIATPFSNYVMHTCADMTKTKNELGFVAKHSLDEGIKLTIEHNLKEK
ncbi:MAG: NAD-dependent epimerase/dehydratase family protein [Candidatus Micrarchaeota archaeon]|nr:NAD-dependent epimerase/dehydratase family protein [Candidatus Micrarchaeota archaeon]